MRATFTTNQGAGPRHRWDLPADPRSYSPARLRYRASRSTCSYPGFRTYSAGTAPSSGRIFGRAAARATTVTSGTIPAAPARNRRRRRSVCRPGRIAAACRVRRRRRRHKLYFTTNDEADRESGLRFHIICSVVSLLCLLCILPVLGCRGVFMCSRVNVAFLPCFYLALLSSCVNQISKALAIALIDLHSS